MISSQPQAMLNYYVDLRWITYVNGSEILLASHPWGRALSAMGDGLNNVSRGSFELAVITPGVCERFLAK